MMLLTWSVRSWEDAEPLHWRIMCDGRNRGIEPALRWLNEMIGCMGIGPVPLESHG